MEDNIKDGSSVSKKTPKVTDAVTQFGAFFTNDNHAFLVRKSERLASAIHMVTGFVTPEEPIRLRLRALALDVVQASARVQNFSHLGPMGFGALCAELATLLETAESSGMVSSMNAGLISDEYAKLATFAKERYSIIGSVMPNLSELPPAAPSPLDFYKGQKDIPSYRTYKKTETVNKGQQNEGRQKDILSLFLQKDRISIKDAAAAIPGVSEKTIQRELLAMVEAGLLIKEGERRWSTYRKAGI
jgi:hypothetical protein